MDSNYNQWTPLDLAASKGWTKTCSVLLDNDAPVDPTDKNKVRQPTALWPFLWLHVCCSFFFCVKPHLDLSYKHMIRNLFCYLSFRLVCLLTLLLILGFVRNLHHGGVVLEQNNSLCVCMRACVHAWCVVCVCLCVLNGLLILPQN